MRSEEVEPPKGRELIGGINRECVTRLVSFKSSVSGGEPICSTPVGSAALVRWRCPRVGTTRFKSVEGCSPPIRSEIRQFASGGSTWADDRVAIEPEKDMLSEKHGPKAFVVGLIQTVPLQVEAMKTGCGQPRVDGRASPCHRYSSVSSIRAERICERKGGHTGPASYPSSA